MEKIDQDRDQILKQGIAFEPSTLTSVEKKAGVIMICAANFHHTLFFMWRSDCGRKKSGTPEIPTLIVGHCF